MNGCKLKMMTCKIIWKVQLTHKPQKFVEKPLYHQRNYTTLWSMFLDFYWLPLQIFEPDILQAMLQKNEPEKK